MRTGGVPLLCSIHFSRSCSGHYTFKTSTIVSHQVEIIKKYLKKFLERKNLIWRMCYWINFVLLWNLIHRSKSEPDTQGFLPSLLTLSSNSNLAGLSPYFPPANQLAEALIFYKCHTVIKLLCVSCFSPRTNFYSTGRSTEGCNFLDLDKICYSKIITVCF